MIQLEVPIQVSEGLPNGANAAIFERKKQEDPTQLISTYEATELVGIVSLLYGMLLHSGAPSRGDLSPPELPQHTMAVILTGIKMLNNMATFSGGQFKVDVSGVLCSEFTEEKILENQAKSSPSSTSKKAQEKEAGDQRMSLLSRFPREQLTAAQEYFKVS
uniref:Uncharacterized protein n=1 Tax=Magallana gigas TaxID=29159 RepID=K1QK90_MAGGI